MADRLAHAAAAIEGVLVEQREVVPNPNHRPRVAGKRDDRAGTEDRVDGAALEAELAQVRSR
jgi:hypothetical protein